MWHVSVFLIGAFFANANNISEKDGEESRKILGSSVVTSVSVITDTGNGSKLYTDAVGKPVSKPLLASDLASPIDLLNPDRYEFYTFDDSGDLVKRLMTMEEIQGILATGDGDGLSLDSLTSQGFMPEKRVNDVVNNVQNVLKGEVANHKPDFNSAPIMDTPDVSDSWSMILPAIFGNTGEDIKLDKPTAHVTPDTIMLEPEQQETVSPKIKITVKPTVSSVSTTTEEESLYSQEKLPSTTDKNVSTSVKGTSETESPMINVDIITNFNSSTEKISNSEQSSQVIEIKPISFNESTKYNTISSVDNITYYKPLTTTTHVNIQITQMPSTTIQTPITITDEPLTTLSTASKNIFTTNQVSQSESSSTTLRPTTITSHAATQNISQFKPPKTTATNTTTESLPTLLEILNENSPNFDAHVSETVTILNNFPTTEKTDGFTTIHETTPSFGTLNTLFSTDADDQIKPKTTTLQTIHTTTTEGNDLLLNESIYNNITTENFGNTNFKIVTERQKTNSSPIMKGDDATESYEGTSEILDNLLLTTTNIYEINSKLFDRTTSNAEPDVEDKFTTTTTTTTTTTDSEFTVTNEYGNPTTTTTTTTADIVQSTTMRDATTTVKDEGITDASSTMMFTTKENLISNIEQILSQVESNIDGVEGGELNVNKIQEIISNTPYRTQPELLQQTVTVASNLIASDAPIRTTEENILDDIVSDSTILTDSVSSLLSQVVNSNLSLTTIDFPTSTERITSTNEYTNKEITEKSDTEGTTTLTTIKQEPTTQKHAITEDDDLLQTTTTDNNEDAAKTTETVSHIINITIINSDSRKNQTKPAKSDTSLEMEYEQVSDETNKTDSELLKVETIVAAKTNVKPSTNIIENTTTDTPLINEFDLMVETTTSLQETTFSESITTQQTSTILPPISSSSVIITINDDVNDSDKHEKLGKPEGTWTLVSTISPHDDGKEITNKSATRSPGNEVFELSPSIDLTSKPLQGFGLEDSITKLEPDIYQFVQLCNELAFGFWKSVTNGISTVRSVVVSPFAATSLLAMVFLGARGATSGEMNEILKLDDMVTFNPHLIFKNVTESIQISPTSGVAVSVIVRELFSDRSKGKLLNFYKERARQFYDGHVEEASFREIGDIIRRRTNLLIKKHTYGKIAEYLKDSTIIMKPPLAGISASIFQTDCLNASSAGRDGEIHFVVLPSIRQRRLIPIPAIVYKTDFLAGYEPSIDATAVAIGNKDHVVSTIFVMAGQQGVAAPGDGLTRLEKRLVESSFKQGAWSRLLRTLIPRPGLEVQIPRFSHRSVINATVSLQQMGLNDLFDAHKADLRGLNGIAHELHLSDMLQINNFATCGENRIGESHHLEVYPATANRIFRKAKHLDYYESENRYIIGDEPRDYQRAFHDPLHDPSYLSLPLSLRPRQARLPETPRLKFDRPFLYFVRHNPTGLILHMGRFHPRLLP